MVDFINISNSLGLAIVTGTTTLTGSAILTFFIVLIVFCAICLMFGIKLEYAAILILPFCLGLAAYYSSFILAVALILIFLAFIFTQQFIIR